MARPTYLWRQLTAKQREKLMAWRKRQVCLGTGRLTARAKRPAITSPPLVFEHRHYIGHSSERMQSFCETLVGLFDAHSVLTHAWCVLPNHYHALIEATDVLAVLTALGRMHGRLSFLWNGEEHTPGLVRSGRAIHAQRPPFLADDELHPSQPRASRWQGWPFSSAPEYLAQMGREFAEKTWHEYPVLDYGKGWDNPNS